MKTASYYSFKGPGRIGITVGTPRGISGLVFFRALAPHRNMLKGLTPEQYIERFDDILRQLDPRETWDRLHELVAPLEPVLLCYERPPFTRENWCHRRAVADWFKATLGEVVEEIGHGDVPKF